MTSPDALNAVPSAPKKRVRRPERVTLTVENAERIDQWNDQLAPRLSGRRLSRSDFVNWLVGSRDGALTDGEVAFLHTKHFDPIKALEWAVRQAKTAQALHRQDAGQHRNHIIIESQAVSQAPQRTAVLPQFQRCNGCWR